MADEAVATGTPRGLTVDERNKPILDVVGDQAVGRTAVGDLGAGRIELQGQTVQPEEELTTAGKTFESSLSAPTAQFTSSDTTITPQTATPSGAGVARTIDINQVPLTNAQIPDAVNLDGVLSNQSQVDSASVIDTRTKEELLSRGTLAAAKTATLAQEATVQYQLEQLYASLEDGKPLPGWASANVRKVQNIMNARGLGASSVAAAAMVQAISESALPIAVQDANKYATIQLANLNNEQKTALTNAAALVSIDARNLDNRMKAAQQNAQSFLQMDLTDVKNDQAGAVLKYQSEVQSLFTDAAAENARLQFNAKNQTQIDQYYDQLGATVSKANNDREVATKQFNADQSNSMTKYLEKIEDSRDKFNANMQLQIDQANTMWRRTINTANTELQNDANKLNASALLGMTVQAQNNLWQKYRDEASFSFQSTQNELQRTQQLAQVAIANQFAEDMFDAQLDAETSKEVSGFFGDILKGVFKNAADSLGKTLFGPS